VAIYSNLIPYLGQDQPLYGLIRTSNDQKGMSVEEIATHYLTEISKVQSQGPYFLGGLSFGGLVAFEIAQQLLSKGEKVALLALLDTPGPGAYQLKPLTLQMLGHLSNLFQFGFPYFQTKIGERLRKLFRNQILSKKTQKPDFSTKMIPPQLFRQLAKARSKEYQYKVYAGTITLFQLSERKALTDSLFDPALGYVDPLLGWGAIATQGVESYEIPGEHTTILREPHVKLLGEKLKLCLDKAHTA
jgi:thioesterase domain-containing protein